MLIEVLLLLDVFNSCVWLACDGVSELSTCILCVCLSGSVYCEEVVPEMTTVPPLPKETAYLYARYNQIAKIANKDFADYRELEAQSFL